MGKTKDLSKDCKNIVLNLFKFFQLEKARGRPFYSPDNLIKRTCKAAGISYSSVYRVVNGKSPPESNRPKERKKTLDDFDRCVGNYTDHLLLTSDHIKASYYRRIVCTYNQDLIKLK
jgi:hypothetical protein